MAQHVVAAAAAAAVAAVAVVVAVREAVVLSVSHPPAFLGGASRLLFPSRYPMTTNEHRLVFNSAVSLEELQA